MNEVGAVLVKFKDDLKWIEQISSSIDIYVYNKCGDPNDIGNINLNNISKNVNLGIINILPDKGKDAGTYAYHMFTNYDKLNDYTLFMQGHGQEHCTSNINIVSILNNPENIKYTKYDRSNNNSFSMPNIQTTKDCIDFAFLGYGFCHMDIRYIDPVLHGWTPYHDDLTKNPFYKFIDNPDRPEFSWDYGASGQFIVSKKLILKHPPEYYKELYDLINNYIDPSPDPRIGPNFGSYMMEPLWQWIF